MNDDRLFSERARARVLAALTAGVSKRRLASAAGCSDKVLEGTDGPDWWCNGRNLRSLEAAALRLAPQVAGAGDGVALARPGEDDRAA